MADCADTCELVATVHLVRASIDRNALIAVACCLRQLRLVRPDCLRAAAGSFAFASVYDVNHFYIAVVIPVVRREVETVCVSLAAGSGDHALGVLVVKTVALIVGDVLAVALHRTECVRTYNIECDIELAAALCAEVVGNATLKTVLTEALFIGNACVERFGVCHRELLVGELSEEDKATLVALVLHLLCV